MIGKKSARGRSSAGESVQRKRSLMDALLSSTRTKHQEESGNTTHMSVFAATLAEQRSMLSVEERQDLALEFVAEAMSRADIFAVRWSSNAALCFHRIIRTRWYRVSMSLLILAYSSLAMFEPVQSWNAQEVSTPLWVLVCEVCFVVVITLDLAAWIFMSSWGAFVYQRTNRIRVVIVALMVVDVATTLVAELGPVEARLDGLLLRFSRPLRPALLLWIHSELLGCLLSAMNTLPMLADLLNFGLLAVTVFSVMAVMAFGVQSSVREAAVESAISNTTQSARVTAGRLLKGGGADDLGADLDSDHCTMGCFDTFGQAFLALCVLLTGDGDGLMVRGMFHYGGSVGPFSVIFILLMTYVWMSIFVAIVFDHYKVIHARRIVEEGQREQIALLGAFQLLDADGSGQLDLAELLHFLEAFESHYGLGTKLTKASPADTPAGSRRRSSAFFSKSDNLVKVTPESPTNEGDDEIGSQQMRAQRRRRKSMAKFSRQIILQVVASKTLDAESSLAPKSAPLAEPPIDQLEKSRCGGGIPQENVGAAVEDSTFVLRSSEERLQAAQRVHDAAERVLEPSSGIEKHSESADELQAALIVYDADHKANAASSSCAAASAVETLAMATMRAAVKVGDGKVVKSMASELVQLRREARSTTRAAKSCEEDTTSINDTENEARAAMLPNSVEDEPETEKRLSMMFPWRDQEKEYEKFPWRELEHREQVGMSMKEKKGNKIPLSASPRADTSDDNDKRNGDSKSQVLIRHGRGQSMHTLQEEALAEAKELMSMLDVDGDGTISQHEFLMVCRVLKRIAMRRKTKRAQARRLAIRARRHGVPFLRRFVMSTPITLIVELAIFIYLASLFLRATKLGSELDDKYRISAPFDFAFMVFFAVEMCLKIVGYGWWPYWADPWDRIDGVSSCLTVSAYCVLTILPYVLAASGCNFDEFSFDRLFQFISLGTENAEAANAVCGNITVASLANDTSNSTPVLDDRVEQDAELASPTFLVVIRLLRVFKIGILFRVFRRGRFASKLLRMVSSNARSLATLVATFAGILHQVMVIFTVIAVLTYAFAVFDLLIGTIYGAWSLAQIVFVAAGMEVWKDLIPQRAYCEPWCPSWSTFPMAMLATFQLLTLSGWSSIMYETIATSSFYYCLIFAIFIILVGFVMVNLFGALVLEIYSVEMTKADEKAKLEASFFDQLWSLPVKPILFGNDGRGLDNDEDGAAEDLSLDSLTKLQLALRNALMTKFVSQPSFKSHESKQTDATANAKSSESVDKPRSVARQTVKRAPADLLSDGLATINAEDFPKMVADLGVELYDEEIVCALKDMTPHRRERAKLSVDTLADGQWNNFRLSFNTLVAWWSREGSKLLFEAVDTNDTGSITPSEFENLFTELLVAQENKNKGSKTKAFGNNAGLLNLELADLIEEIVKDDVDGLIDENEYAWWWSVFDISSVFNANSVLVSGLGKGAGSRDTFRAGVERIVPFGALPEMVHHYFGMDDRSRGAQGGGNSSAEPRPVGGTGVGTARELLRKSSQGSDSSDSGHRGRARSWSTFMLHARATGWAIRGKLKGDAAELKQVRRKLMFGISSEDVVEGLPFERFLPWWRGMLKRKSEIDFDNGSSEWELNLFLRHDPEVQMKKKREEERALMEAVLTRVSRDYGIPRNELAARYIHNSYVEKPPDATMAASSTTGSKESGQFASATGANKGSITKRKTSRRGLGSDSFSPSAPLQRRPSMKKSGAFGNANDSEAVPRRTTADKGLRSEHAKTQAAIKQANVAAQKVAVDMAGKRRHRVDNNDELEDLDDLIAEVEGGAAASHGKNTTGREVNGEKEVAFGEEEEEEEEEESSDEEDPKAGAPVKPGKSTYVPLGFADPVSRDSPVPPYRSGKINALEAQRRYSGKCPNCKEFLNNCVCDLDDL